MMSSARYFLPPLSRLLLFLSLSLLFQCNGLPPPLSPPSFSPVPVTLPIPCAFPSDVVMNPLTGELVVACANSNSVIVYANSNATTPTSRTLMTQLPATLNGTCVTPQAVAVRGTAIFAACKGSDAVMYWRSSSSAGVLFSDTRCLSILDLDVSSSGLLVAACYGANQVIAWDVNALTPNTVIGISLKIPAHSSVLSVSISSLTNSIVAGTLSSGVLFWQNVSATPTTLNGTCPDAIAVSISSLSDTIAAACHTTSAVAYWSSHASSVTLLSSSCTNLRDVIFHPVTDQVYAACSSSTAIHWATPSTISTGQAVLSVGAGTCNSPVAVAITGNGHAYLACSNNMMAWINSTGTGISMPGMCSAIASVTTSPTNRDIFAACAQSNSIIVWRGVNLTSLLGPGYSSPAAGSLFSPASSAMFSVGTLLMPVNDAQLCLLPVSVFVTPVTEDVVVACKLNGQIVKWNKAEGLGIIVGACSGASAAIVLGQDIFAACSFSNNIVRFVGGARISNSSAVIAQTLPQLCQGAAALAIHNETLDLYAACKGSDTLLRYFASSNYTTSLPVNATCAGITAVTATSTMVVGACSSGGNLLVSFPTSTGFSSYFFTPPSVCTSSYAVTPFKNNVYAACAFATVVLNSSGVVVSEVSTIGDQQCVGSGVTVTDEGMFVACSLQAVLAYPNFVPPAPVPFSSSAVLITSSSMPPSNSNSTTPITPITGGGGDGGGGGVSIVVIIVVVVGGMLLIAAIVITTLIMKKRKESKENLSKQSTSVQMNTV